MNKNLTIHLIRHGLTFANEQHLYCGATDLPLNEKGIRQLNALKELSTYTPAKLYITSGMLRANQSLQIIYGDVPITQLPQLAEYNFGEFEMKSYEELKNNKAYIEWITDKDKSISCPMGESKQAYEQRIAKGFESLICAAQKSESDSVAAVMHAGTIVSIMSNIFSNEKNFYEWQPLPGLGYTLSRDGMGLFTYKAIKGED